MKSASLWVGSLICVAHAAGAAAALNEGLYSSLDAPPVLELISKAEKTLDLEVYTMKAPEVIDAIRAALKRKVRVRIVKDPAPFNDDCPLFPEDGGVEVARTGPKDATGCANQRQLVEEVNARSAQGSAFVPFNKAELCKNSQFYCYQHGKIAISDGEVALLSTGNFDPSSLCVGKDLERCNRDYSYVTRDEKIVRSLETVFEDDRVGKKFDLLGMIKSGRIDPRLVVSPYSEIPIVKFIDSARTEILIQNQYLKQPVINAALIRAAKERKVKVKVNVASFCAFGKPDSREIEQAQKIYEAFDSAGVQTRLFTGRQKVKNTPGYLHAKAILVDGARAWVGSVNGSTTSVINNREYGLFFEDAESVALLSAFMNRDFADPEGESWKEGLSCMNDSGAGAPDEQ